MTHHDVHNDQYYAHSREVEGVIEYQLLKIHLVDVAKRCKVSAEVFGAAELSYITGILHDIGKFSLPFQKRVRGSSIRTDHSTAGAQWIMQKANYREVIGKLGISQYLARLVAYIVAGHHGGLQNYGTMDTEGTLKYRLSKSAEDVPAWSHAWKEIDIPPMDRWNITLLQVPGLKDRELAWKYSFLGRMLYSCLVDADSIDTRIYCNPQDQVVVTERPPLTMKYLLSRFEVYMQRLLGNSKDTFVNRYRQQILDACNRQATTNPGLFTLYVPTGGGKTLSSLSFALRHAEEHGLRRIIYVIPFTSIIDQTAKVFRDALGADAVLEHHSNLNESEYEENYGVDEVRRLKLSAENWDASVIVTTSVQFFESLFSNRRSQCRKLHNIANAVIVVDEAQSIPRQYVTPCLRAMQELVQSYGCSVVLCTATQPTWNELGVSPIEIMDQPSPKELFDVFKRVMVNFRGNDAEPVSDTEVVEWMTHSAQVLCIVNTRKHAKMLYDQLTEEVAEGVYHLSGRMCAKHRYSIIRRIRRILAVNKRRKELGMRLRPCRVISTQLIEAGVDVDFPFVIRAMAGLDSIAQAAGRCNREGRLEREAAEVRVFYPEKQGMPTKGWMKETAIETQNVLRYVKDEPLSLAALQQYFDRIYGIYDGNVQSVTDGKNIMGMSSPTNLEIPYEDIGKAFEMIDSRTQAIVIPMDKVARALMKELAFTPYPMQVMRKLQPYTVQVYSNELTAFKHKDLVHSIAGIYVLQDLAYYDNKAGLLQPGGYVEHEVYIF